MSQEIKRSFEVSRVGTDEQRMVWGIVSTDQEATDGFIITREAIEEAWPDYMQFGNIREMHKDIAAGVVRESSMTDAGMGVGVYVADDSTWNKVKAGVLKAFSLRGPILEAVGNVVRKLRIIEISLVDRPADPGALVTMFRADGSGSTETGPQPQEGDAMSEKDREALAASKPAALKREDQGMISQAVAPDSAATEAVEMNVMSEIGSHLDAIGGLVKKMTDMHSAGKVAPEVLAHCQNAHRCFGRAMGAHVKAVTSYGATDEGEGDKDGDEAKRSASMPVVPFIAAPSKIETALADLVRKVDEIAAKPSTINNYQPVIPPASPLRSLEKADDVVRVNDEPEDKDPKEGTPEWSTLSEIQRFEIADRRQIALNRKTSK